MALDAEKRSGQGEKDLGAKVDRNPMRVEKRFGQDKKDLGAKVDRDPMCVEKRFGQGKKDLSAKERKYAGMQPAAHAGGKEATRTKVCKTEPAIPLHTCLPCMAGASQGAFVVIPEIS